MGRPAPTGGALHPKAWATKPGWVETGRERAKREAARLDEGAVVRKATQRASEALGISDAGLARIVGVSAASISRLRSGARALDAAEKEGELALLLLRAYRSLRALLGDDDRCRRWMHAENVHLGAFRPPSWRASRGSCMSPSIWTRCGGRTSCGPLGCGSTATIAPR